MSQNPQPPYASAPTTFDTYRPAGDPMAHARRASTLLFVFGGMLAGLGLLVIVQTVSTSPSELQAAFEQQSQSMPGGGPLPFSIETLKTIGLVMYSIVGVVGLAMIGLGVGTRQGSRGAMIGAISLCGVVGLFLLLFVGLFLIAAMLGNLLAGALAFVLMVPLALTILLVVWLSQALKATPNPAAAIQQYQMLLLQYQQQQQAYQQSIMGQAAAPPIGGYGYGVAPAKPSETSGNQS